MRATIVHEKRIGACEQARARNTLEALWMIAARLEQCALVAQNLAARCAVVIDNIWRIARTDVSQDSVQLIEIAIIE